MSLNRRVGKPPANLTYKGIMSGLLVNEVFIKRFYSDYGGSDGTSHGINPNLIGKSGRITLNCLTKITLGITVSCLQLSAAIGSLLAGYLGDIMGRKRCVRIGGFIYFAMAFVQGFAPNLACFIIGRTIQGLGVGFLSMTVPVIQTEIAAPHRVNSIALPNEFAMLTLSSAWFDGRSRIHLLDWRIHAFLLG